MVGERPFSSDTTVQSRPARPGGLSASLTLAWRALLKLKHVPSQLVDATLYPILITLMMTYIFGGSLAGSQRQELANAVSRTSPHLPVT